MLTQLKRRPFYFIVIFAFICCSAVISLLVPKQLSFEYLNQYHNNWMDSFFIRYTCLGDGLVSVLAVLVLLFTRKYKAAVLLLAAFSSSGLLACLFKNFFSLPRPRLYFEQLHIVYSNFIDGITLSNNSSFPSGHTASAFAMATVIVLLSHKKAATSIAMIAALLVAYSRMYLGQHFLPDITAGAFLGIVCTMVSYYIIYQKQVTIKAFRKNKYSMNQEISPQWN